MRSAWIAAWILSLVLPPDRAASTVGDWMEDVSARGPVWFWSCVVRTFVARVWSDLSGSPIEMIGLGFRGWLYSVLLSVGSLLLLMPIAIVFGLLVAGLAQILPLPHVPPYAQTALGAVAGTAWLAACDFRTGKWIARRAPGTEIAACVAACLVPRLFFFVLGTIAMHFWGGAIYRFLITQAANARPDWTIDFYLAFPFEIFLFLGAMAVRREILRSTPA